MSESLIIGTRGSKLALWQAHFVKNTLEQSGISCSLKIIKTKGDQIQHLSFDKIEGKGFFTKELEDALLNGEIDLAVHSMKDMPTSQPNGLVLAGISKRADPTDWLIVSKNAWVAGKPLGLSDGATVGTSSARRKAMLHFLRPDLKTRDIRGNVPTRIEKLTTEGYDAIILAAAGLTRLEIDLDAYKVIKLNPREFIPAPAQGVLTYQCRKDDIAVRQTLLKIHDADAHQTVRIEREVLQKMDGGCHIPLGVYVFRDKNGFYHGYAGYAPDVEAPLIIAQHSSSTSVDMAAQLFSQLKNT